MGKKRQILYNGQEEAKPQGQVFGWLRAQKQKTPFHERKTRRGASEKAEELWRGKGRRRS